MFVTVCAWDGRTQSIEWTHEGETVVSHGICIACRSKFLSERPSPPPGVAEAMLREAERE